MLAAGGALIAACAACCAPILIAPAAAVIAAGGAGLMLVGEIGIGLLILASLALVVFVVRARRCARSACG